MKCLDCKVEMVERINKRTKTHFWGCPNFPKCKLTHSLHPFASKYNFIIDTYWDHCHDGIDNEYDPGRGF